MERRLLESVQYDNDVRLARSREFAGSIYFLGVFALLNLCIVAGVIVAYTIPFSVCVKRFKHHKSSLIWIALLFGGSVILSIAGGAIGLLVAISSIIVTAVVLTVFGAIRRWRHKAAMLKQGFDEFGDGIPGVTPTIMDGENDENIKFSDSDNSPKNGDGDKSALISRTASGASKETGAGRGSVGGQAQRTASGRHTGGLSSFAADTGGAEGGGNGDEGRFEAFRERAGSIASSVSGAAAVANNPSGGTQTRRSSAVEFLNNFEAFNVDGTAETSPTAASTTADKTVRNRGIAKAMLRRQSLAPVQSKEGDHFNSGDGVPHDEGDDSHDEGRGLLGNNPISMNTVDSKVSGQGGVRAAGRSSILKSTTPKHKQRRSSTLRSDRPPSSDEDDTDDEESKNKDDEGAFDEIEQARREAEAHKELIEDAIASRDIRMPSSWKAAPLTPANSQCLLVILSLIVLLLTLLIIGIIVIIWDVRDYTVISLEPEVASNTNTSTTLVDELLDSSSTLSYYDRSSNPTNSQRSQRLVEFQPKHTAQALQLAYAFPSFASFFRLQPLLKSATETCGLQFTTSSSKSLIADWIDMYDINMADFVPSDPNAYDSLDAWFVRRIRSLRRPQPVEPTFITAPAEARTLVFDNEFKARGWFKGYRLSYGNLLGGDAAGSGIPAHVRGEVLTFLQKGQIVISRLAPQDYHRFHAPVGGTIIAIHSIEGPYFSVSADAARSGNDIFLNQRKVVILDAGARVGYVAIVAIGATCVGNVQLSTPLSSSFSTTGDSDSEIAPELVPLEVGMYVERGAEMGAMHFGGSTIVTLWGQGRVEFDSLLLQRSRYAVETHIRVNARIGATRGE